MKTKTVYVGKDGQQPGLWLWVLREEELFKNTDGEFCGKSSTILNACDVSFRTRKQAIRDALKQINPDARLEVEAETTEG